MTERNMKWLFVMYLLCVLGGEIYAQNGWRRILDAPTFGFAANPKNTRTLYAGGIGRVLYRSFDEGRSWDTLPIEFRTGTAQITNVVVHPIDTNVVFAGGISFGTLRRSNNMGNSWEIVLPDTNHSTYNMVFSGEAVIIDPTDSRRMFAAEFQRGAIYRSTDRGRTWDSLATLPLDTTDTPPSPPRLCSITMRPDSSNILFAGCTSSRIYRSTDGGVTWTFLQQLYNNILNDTEIPQIRFSPTTPRIGYVVMTYFFHRLRPNGGVFRTTDGGDTWHPLVFPDTSFWAVGLRSLGNTDEIFVGGYTDITDTTLADTIVPGERVVRRSTDGGKTWIAYDDEIPWGAKLKSNVMAFRYVGTSPENMKLYMTTEAGLFVFDSLSSTSKIRQPDAKPPLILSLLAPDEYFVQFEQEQPSANPAIASVYDLNGRMVTQTSLKRYGSRSFFGKLSLNNLAAGAYYLNVVSGDQVESTNLLVGK